MAENQETEQPSDAVSPSHQTVKTGWRNVKDAYIFKRETGEISREVYELILMFVLGSGAGWIYGGMPASAHARNRYIQTSDAAIYSSKLEAVGTTYNAGARGFIRYGFRWGWRTGLLAVGFHGISSLLAVYRDRTDIFNYTAASVCTGALYRLNMGIRGSVGGAVLGAFLGVPAGCLILGMQKLYGDTFLEINKKARQERIQEQKQELMEKEKYFGKLIEHFHTSLNSEKNDGDPHR